ncbi:MAG: restriction endonuclease [Clostridiaceae bacterium]
MSYNIEIAVSENISNTEKGRLLENLGKDILESMQYEVIEEVRMTGIEVDLLAKHKVSGEEVYVECKAHKDSLSADVLTKLLGNVTFYNVSSGWLLTTGTLGKDAEGMKLNWESRPAEIRRKLQIYTNDRIINTLISTHTICNTSFVVSIKDKIISNEHTLLINEYGRFWIIPLIEAQAGIPYGVMVFDSKTGNRINDKSIIEKISKINCSFKDLEWINEDAGDSSNMVTSIIEESQSIVTISGGDKWSDYRPSRPEDFVGRDKILGSIFDLFNNVLNRKTDTRLFSITSPSGWGKSSVALKLIDISKSKKNKNKFFIYGVDVRTAISNRYPELALKACIEEAVKSKFIYVKDNTIKITSINNPFDDPSMRQILKQLREEQKVIVLFFDQFEETFSKKELSTLFDNVRKLSYAVDAIKENFLLGFAWKTDLSIPADHSAYYMWHMLSDRRREFELTQFSEKDISKALSIFSKEVGANINPILKRYLTDQCQGYPWLLKKLCIHVYTSLENGIDQNEILGKSLNIKELFEKDLRMLTPDEDRCIFEIAKESPADYFKITEIFTDTIVQGLLNKRLVLRRASRLILYWDIFKDYVLTKTIPEIYVNYIPQMTFTTFTKTLLLLLKEKESKIDTLADKLGNSKRTVENIIIDLAMFGIVEKLDDKIVLTQFDLEAALKIVYDFFKSHIIIKKLRDINAPINIDEFNSIFSSIYQYKDKTKSAYINKLLGWLKDLKLIKVSGNIISIKEDASEGPGLILNDNSGYVIYRRKTALFLGQTSPVNVMELINYINKNKCSKLELYNAGFRNALSVLESVGAIDYEKDIPQINITFDEIINRIKKTDSFKATSEFLLKNKDASYIDVGKYVGSYLGKRWSESSQKRYGGALKLWNKYITSK